MVDWSWFQRKKMNRYWSAAKRWPRVAQRANTSTRMTKLNCVQNVELSAPWSDQIVGSLNV